jgi:hypothetical protein
MSEKFKRQVEITPEMNEAGAAVLWGNPFLGCSPSEAESSRRKDYFVCFTSI